MLCDDDEFFWENWNEVEKAIQNDEDVIFTATYSIKDKNNIADLVKQATFLPACIYKTKLITNDVMQNAMANIINLFPHLAVFSEAINNKVNIFVPDAPVIKMVINPNENAATYTRGQKKSDVHPHYRNIFWLVGYLNSIQMIKNKDLRAYLLDNLNFENRSLFSLFKMKLHRNRQFYDGSLKNLLDIFYSLNARQKLVFIIAYIVFQLDSIVRKIGKIIKKRAKI